VTVETPRIDVARIMHEIRTELRARHNDLEQRIERARQQLMAAHPGHEPLRHAVARFMELFDPYYTRTIEWLAEQEPNYQNMRQAVQELNRLVNDPAPPRGPRDRWWNPWYWAKRALEPLRRYILRRPNETTAIMRDMLIYLVNHSSHLEIERTRLQMGVEAYHATNALLGANGLLYHFFTEWPRTLPRPVLEYVAENLEKFLDREARQVETIARGYLASSFQEHERRSAEQFAGLDQRVAANFAELEQRSAATLGSLHDLEQRASATLGSLNDFEQHSAAAVNRLERWMASIAPGKASAMTGFDARALADSLRGDEAAIGARQQRYLDYMRLAPGTVLDAGCGRGEMLALLRESGISAYGVDISEPMAEHARGLGLDVRCEDVLDHLALLEDNSLGGIIALQLVEHLDFPSQLQLVRVAAKKLAVNGLVLLETINPTCLTVFSGALYADPTHLRPLHPEGMRRLLIMGGLGEVRFEYARPVPESDRLKPLSLDGIEAPALREAVETLNFDLDRINSVLYGYSDYAAIAWKLGPS
jgi:2-polyprenyl-3-methyl-5-hydroxy-6-metoxy-1,4-benzoquinol methylase